MASILAVLSFKPYGTLTLTTCQATSVSDWYSILHNPTPYYRETLHCSQEAVYPLYSIIFVFLGYSLIFLLLFRGVATSQLRHLVQAGARKTIYLTLYGIPIIAVLHAVFAGLLYYSFPYMVIVSSVVSIASHLASRKSQRLHRLCRDSVSDPRNVVIILSHWFVHSYGLIAATVPEYGIWSFWSLLAMPLPTLFYIATSKFTDPEKLHSD